jgi:methionyl-tRNA formyltransferase
MKIVFMGCVAFSVSTLEHLLNLKDAQVVGVITRQSSPLNADFRSLEPLAIRAGIPCFFAEGNQQDGLATWIRDLSPDVVYCFGWSYLLKKDILALPRLGVIGYHPAELPRNRGRHPIIWALALGLPMTASTFFFMDEGADSGDILSREKVPIFFTEDAASLYERLTVTACRQITVFTAQLSSGRFPRIPQDHSMATTWRKRSMKDGEIDWRMSSRSIYNLVRALTRPYPGAHCVVDGSAVKIWKAEVADSLFPDVLNLEPGKVIKVGGSDVFIKCGEGVLRIIHHEFDKLPKEGTYL